MHARVQEWNRETEQPSIYSGELGCMAISAGQAATRLPAEFSCAVPLLPLTSSAKGSASSRRARGLKRGSREF
jgi:hypothetical protein